MDYKAARLAMVNSQLATNHIISEPLLEAMQSVPREQFVPEDKVDIAYIDEDLNIGEGRFLLEPMVFARMVQALAPQPDEVVLDVACGSGYSSAVLSKLAQTVIAVEANEHLIHYATNIWKHLDLCNIAELQEDVAHMSNHGPYDMILINGAVSTPPESLIAQLKESTGRLVCVLRKKPESNGQVVLIKRTQGDQYNIAPLFDANVPYVQEFAPQERFAF